MNLGIICLTGMMEIYLSLEGTYKSLNIQNIISPEAIAIAQQPVPILHNLISLSLPLTPEDLFSPQPVILGSTVFSPGNTIMI